jgi:2-polyprenyl-3-methyl-5-hydroxy-6-metoxy-1,4-benzoquinol methylase
MARVRRQWQARRGSVAELAELLARWRDDLASWAIPGHIMGAVADSPWVLPHEVFARRADRLSADPDGPSYERARAALDPPGSLLDVGAGAGAACLPLLPAVTRLTAVDADGHMLELLAGRAAALGTAADCVTGRWPEVAAAIPVADVVTCHHVLYNVADLEPFVAALSAHARRQVVAEVTASHPLISLNGLWQSFHGLARPVRPTADDLIAILEAMGCRPAHQRWARTGRADYASFAELVDVTRRRLCLPAGRAREVADELVRSGVDPKDPVDLGSSGRELVTIWWDGAAGPD